MTDDLLHQESPRIRFAASPDRHTIFMALNYLSQARSQPYGVQISEAGPFVPDGDVGEAWHLCLGFRKSGHGGLHSTHTMPVSAIIPNQNRDNTGKITALLTYPIAEEIVAADVRVTWTYR
ncbi:hypothetical protein FIBSPDRAFT_848863, partial [Athelia psychrophila]